MTSPAGSPSRPETIREALFNRRMLICVFTGFSSGLPLFIFLNLLPAWLDDAHISIKAIGLMALLQVPYVAKFLWAPVLDHFAIASLGRRRGWLIVLHLALVVAIALLGQLDPATQLALIPVLGLLLSFLSASLDVVIDAFRREILPDAELGLGNSIHVNAYKIAGLVPGALSLFLADHLPWPAVFAITALFMLPGLGMALLVREPELKTLPPRTLQAAVVEPFREFIGRNGIGSALTVLAFIFFYKLGDSLATSLATKFYLDMGFSKSEIAAVAKNAALWPSIVGGLVGGLWMVRLGINKALWVFGFAQLIVIPGFAWLSMVGHDLVTLALVVGAEAFGIGLGTAAFVAFIARSTHPAYTATQLALLTALAAVPRTVINAYAGFLVADLGWTNFFWLCTALGIPGMLLLLKVAPWHGDRNREDSRAAAQEKP
ncbi:MAG: AmpG family muropeptide MFS transporter [Pseudomonadota bacterium]